MEPADVLRVVVGCTACGYRDNAHRVRTRWSGPTLARAQDAPIAMDRELRLGDQVPGLELGRARFHAVSRCERCGSRWCWWVLTSSGRVLDLVPVEGDDGRCEACRIAWAKRGRAHRM